MTRHATFIVECNQETFDAYGFGEMSQQETIADLREDLCRGISAATA
jgi:hypothetical protein